MLSSVYKAESHDENQGHPQSNEGKLRNLSFTLLNFVR